MIFFIRDTKLHIVIFQQERVLLDQGKDRAIYSLLLHIVIWKTKLSLMIYKNM